MHTSEYGLQLVEMHGNGTNWGLGAARHAKFIREYFKTQIRQNKLETVLDWGCGKGLLGEALEGLKVTNYDPGVPEFSTVPEGTFDLVVATHVLEHIEPELLDSTLHELDRLMRRYGFFEVPHQPAIQWLPDGRNAHLTVQDHHWWKKKLRAIWGSQLTMLWSPERRNTRYVVNKDV